jgi:hypothetical protein
MRALKTLVVVMGVLLVGGLAVLVVAVIDRVQHRPPAAASLGPVHVDLPPGAHIAASEMSGDRLMVRVTLPDGTDEVRLFDARTGAAIAIIAARPAN